LRIPFTLLLAFVSTALPACKHTPKEAPNTDTAAAAAEDASVATTTTANDAPVDAADAGGPAGVPVFAFAVQAPIYSAPEWPAKDPTKAAEERQNIVRLGYLRKGERAFAKGPPIAKANCAEGWYEVLPAGYVCGKFVTMDPNSKELRGAPHAPYMDRNLPYDYGLNLTPGTPLYRRIPLKSERRDAEKTLAVGKGVKPSDIAKKLAASGESVPAYLKDTGNPKPTVSFDDLKGESELIATRMLKGFYLSLDRKVESQAGVLWHTASGFYAPKAHLIVHEAKTEFEGIVLDNPDAGANNRSLPLAFVIGTRARENTMDPADKTDGVKRGEKVERFAIFHLTGNHETHADRVYHETDKGFWLRDIDIAIAALPKIPNDIGANERWIDVDIASQSLVAFEGSKPVYATIVSTGRHSDDPEKDHRTVVGTFRIREKHVSTTMDDDGASDGTYRIEDVPWVMYFEKSFALHGAFWHSSFGRERSHGCVNLTPHDARNLFAWAGPKVPEGWHGARATPENPGTRVVVHKH
jgi:lipoprotein-anchoring transpeptidase ErfK/SrfK